MKQQLQVKKITNRLKENVIVGHLIPAGTGLIDYRNIVVGSQEEYDQMIGANKDVLIDDYTN